MHYQGGFHRESLYALNNNGLAALNTDTLHFPLADEKSNFNDTVTTCLLHTIIRAIKYLSHYGQCKKLIIKVQ